MCSSVKAKVRTSTISCGSSCPNACCEAMARTSGADAMAPSFSAEERKNSRRLATRRSVISGSTVERMVLMFILCSSNQRHGSDFRHDKRIGSRQHLGWLLGYVETVFVDNVIAGERYRVHVDHVSDCGSMARLDRDDLAGGEQIVAVFNELAGAVIRGNAKVFEGLGGHEDAMTIAKVDC